MRTTHTYVLLELSRAAYDEIALKLRAAGYDHAFNEDGTIDMHGLAVVASEPEDKEISQLQQLRGLQGRRKRIDEP